MKGVENPYQILNDKLEEINFKLDQLIEIQSEPTMLTFRECCEFIKLSRQTLYGLVSKKKIPFHKRNSRLWFDRSELVSWLKGEGDE